jgi:hypothetical protein
MIKRVRIDGCWYRTLDPEAGIRAYTGPRGAKRFWHGHYSGKAIDYFHRRRHPDRRQRQSPSSRANSVLIQAPASTINLSRR